jgi:hypothetical protein
MTAIFQVVLGVLMLLAGRRLFWLFVGAVGFLLGSSLVNQFLPGESELVILLLASLAGVIGVVLALFFQRIAVGVAGFIAVGYLTTSVIANAGWQVNLPSWLIFLVSGLIGAILTAFLFEWALIILSSLVGANLLLNVFNLEQWIGLIVFFLMFLIGVMIQAKTKG